MHGMMEPMTDETTHDERIDALYRIAMRSAQALLVIDRLEIQPLATDRWFDEPRAQDAPQQVN